MFELTVHLPDKRRAIQVAERQEPRRLTDVLRVAGIPLNTRCGHRGLCNGCMLEVISGQLRHVNGDISAALPGTLVRGCQLALPAAGAAEIHLPARSLLARRPQVVASFQLNVPRAHDPLWQPLSVPASRVAAAGSLSGALCDLAAAELDCGLPVRWNDAAGSIEPDVDGCYHLALEHHGDHRRLGICTLSEPAFGLAVDVGTTTVVVALVDLQSGDMVAHAAALNAQTRMGDNVLTRINVCMTEPRLIQRMQRAVVRNTLSPLIADVLRQARVAPDQLASMVVAGNTTMLHLLLGVDPTSMGTAPFTPTFLEHRVIYDTDLSLGVKMEEATVGQGASHEANSDSPPSGRAVRQCDLSRLTVHLLPGAAAYVGADITAGVLASGMAYRDDTCLLVDLGTNGEIVLRHRGQFIGCATAAGPAFEGAGLTCGMRAGQGAVSHVWLDGPDGWPRIEVIGENRPVGICGTAYIDFVARARQAQLLSPTGRFAHDRHPALVQHEKHGRAMVVAESDDGEPLLITEADVASLLQAKAAIAAGIICLLREAAIEPADVQTVFLAGGFGFHMHVESLLGGGMFPGFLPQQVQTVGNSSLGGAYLTLLDGGALGEIRRICAEMKIVELNLAPDFEMIYVDQLVLP